MRTLERSIEAFVLGRRIRLAAVVEICEAIEPFAAGLAAERRTMEELRSIEEATAAVKLPSTTSTGSSARTSPGTSRSRRRATTT